MEKGPGAKGPGTETDGSASEKIRLRAPAKVNLFLEIRGKRADGYHEIRSLLQPIDLFDTLLIEPRSQGMWLRCPGHPELENETNLVLKAARLLEKELRRPLSLSIRLQKNIPMGAGLGGGSSDAAAALIGINLLLGRPIPYNRMTALASRIGSDVPFFLMGTTAMVSGRGEIVDPWPDFPHYWYVLIFPGFSISTAWAYAQVKFPLTGNKKSINIERLKKEGLAGEEDLLFNDLEKAVSPFHPEIQKIKEALQAQGCRQALMSGSGSTVFGIWDQEKPAREARRRLKDQGWDKVFLARGISDWGVVKR